MDRATDIATLYEAGCEDAGRDRVCRSRGGESCAFDGAMIVLQPVADAAHVVHGPLSCCANTWASRGVLSAAGDLHRRGFSSDMRELDVIYGAEGRLLDTVMEVIERVRPAAVFVYATCVSGISGEDIGAVCRQAEARSGLPCVPVDSPGFVGPKNLGNRIAGEALIGHVIATAEPALSTAFDVAIIGEYNVAGDLDLVEPLLSAAGIRVLSRITGNARFEELRWAHRAKVSLLVCGRALVNVAKHLRDSWGVPYVEGSFFGPSEIAKALRAIARTLEARSPEAVGVSDRVERVIAEQDARLVRLLAGVENLRGRKAVLYSGGVKSWAMVAALRDLGIEVAAVGVRKTSHEDEEKLRGLLAPDVPVVEDVSPAVMRRLMAETGASILVAGGRNRFLAAKEGWPFVDVNQERHTAYAGYDGFVALATDLSRSVSYHERERSATLPEGHGEIASPARAAVIDPLKSSASLGAVMALQGIDGALPMIHGAQGCSFLEKVALVKHFNEPVSLATSALFTEEVVLGSEEKLASRISDAMAKQRPALVGVVTTSLVEVKGDDASEVVGRFAVGAPVVLVTASDHERGLESGWAATVSALLELAEPLPTDPALVTVLAGPHITPGDATELRETIEAFDLVPIIVPDMAAMDGGRAGHGPLSDGGTSVGELRVMGASAHTLVAGGSLEPSAVSLKERFGTPYTVFDGLSSIRDHDDFLQVLSGISGREVPARLLRRRAVLLDAMRDAQLLIGGARVALALEADHAVQVSRLLWEMGADTVAAVVPERTDTAGRIIASRVVVGDLTDVPEVEVLISNSHAEDTAARSGADLVTLGFPAHGRFDAARRVTIGYRGAASLVAELADLMIARRSAAHAAAPEKGASR